MSEAVLGKINCYRIFPVAYFPYICMSTHLNILTVNIVLRVALFRILDLFQLVR